MLLASLLQVAALIATLVEHYTHFNSNLREIIFDYTTVTFTMLILLFVARKTSKDLEKKNGEQFSLLADNSDKTNMFEETVFRGSILDTTGEQLVFLTNNKTAEDYYEPQPNQLTLSSAALLSAQRVDGGFSEMSSLNSEEVLRPRDLTSLTLTDRGGSAHTKPNAKASEMRMIRSASSQNNRRS